MRTRKRTDWYLPGCGLLILAVAFAPTRTAALPKGESARPYFGKNFEQTQVLARKYVRAYHEGILITGTSGYIEGGKAALGLIEEKDPRSWYFVRKHIRRITLTGHSGIDIGGGRFTSPERGERTTSDAAGEIVHDAWHRELYTRGGVWEGRDAERFCLEKQNAFLLKAGGTPIDVEWALGSEYWKVDYWSRDW